MEEFIYLYMMGLYFPVILVLNFYYNLHSMTTNVLSYDLP